ncbi:hypothetical protein F53441_10545 [Fusarium austroafricanum]|uniref:Uncharacterized protein n=1 Tax=Fusarium austroafricanum TaxID=2364996 RepID=A0A8H4K9C4_9HYPO|nr:hypothetical protein F53441_10545 [Fusarium austroafricanum]
MSLLVFCNVPHAPRDVPLGSLVLNLRHPNQGNVTSSSLDLVEGVDYSSREQQDFKGLLEAGKNTSFWAQITSLLSFHHGKSKTESLALEAKAGKLYELTSPEDLFKKLCQDKKVQARLTEQSQQRYDTFFIVGWRTFVDSQVETVGEETANAGAKAKAPVGKAVKANFGVDVADAADIEAGGQRSTQKSGQESYGMEGEYVYAIQYRKVKANKTDLGASKIDRDGFWRVFTDNRGMAAERPDAASPTNFEYYEGVFDNSKTYLGEGKEGKEYEDSESRILVTTSGEKYVFLETVAEEEEDDDEDLDEDAI